ncbi:heterokaryon incompatibility protein-domain-containing protein [Epithele typhae]|uniref:heterokaryon incompatibility protein-domain-containing protein n=1 Tax=Epithele typhae TaxID=378194 RepID=UPI002007BC44|nr:heterokaryon incompatibility protein-domain-containing protein [Epithele typhae]KAH9945889.1 heterokaryon incompatibility protein-domain-containing protein [Epithele typhae]
MRLLDLWTGLFVSVDHPQDVSFAILSHVWDGSNELSYEQLSRIQTETLAFSKGDTSQDQIIDKLPPKVKNFCLYARKQGYKYGWADMCCIDKSSSAELSEAINSMYEWYRQATVCYAYLADVDDHGCTDPLSVARDQLASSRWFTRGWTLQELIAPRVVVFLSRGWRLLGTKDSLSRTITQVTGISHDILSHSAPISSATVACRMSWAASRRTTRVEDEAYSLLGIFGVHMPTIYGEGRHAFLRLQEEIMKQVPDQSIFAWGPQMRWEDGIDKIAPLVPSHSSSSTHSPALLEGSLLAMSPRDFKDASGTHPLAATTHPDFRNLLGRDIPLPSYSVTPYGIHATLPIIPLSVSTDISRPQVLLVVLATADTGAPPNKLFALLLTKQASSLSAVFLAGGVFSDPKSGGTTSRKRIVLVSPTMMTRLRASITLKELHVFHRPANIHDLSPHTRQLSLPCVTTNRTDPSVAVAPWCLQLLTAQGFSVSTPHGSNGVEGDNILAYNTFVLIRSDISVQVAIGHCVSAEPHCHPTIATAQTNERSTRISVTYCSVSQSEESTGSKSEIKFSPHVHEFSRRSLTTSSESFSFPSLVLMLSLRKGGDRDSNGLDHIVVDIEVVDDPAEIGSGGSA